MNKSKIIQIQCPCCNRSIELQIDGESGEVTTLFCCDNGIEFGVIPFKHEKGGEKKNE